MKRVYERPAVYVEAMQLDKPIAAGCDADRDDMNDIMGELFNYFNEYMQCKKVVGEGSIPDFDTICYHTNVIKALIS